MNGSKGKLLSIMTTEGYSAVDYGGVTGPGKRQSETKKRAEGRMKKKEKKEKKREKRRRVRRERRIKCGKRGHLVVASAVKPKKLS
jgi:50S ribosomal subunit-associated GTPase HflX